MKATFISIIATIMTLTFSPLLLAFLPGDPLEITLDIIVNPVEGPPIVSCGIAKILKERSNLNRWITMTGPTLSPGDKKPLDTSPVTCGDGIYDLPTGDASEWTNTPDFLAMISNRIAVIRRSEDERVVSVKLTANVKVLPWEDNGQVAEYQDVEIVREFSFTENREALVPLLVADSEQIRALGVREVFLRVTIKEQVGEETLVYGTIRVTSGLKNAHVLLDGGKVGSISGSEELFLRNVRTGVHEISLSGPENLQLVKTVRVQANRTALVVLNTKDVAQNVTAFGLETLGQNEHGYQEYRRNTDGAVVVKIPEGEFLMGNVETERSPLEHKVYLSTYLIDKMGVTWGQYRIFAEATGIPLPPHDPYWGIPDDHPAVFVTWEESKNYCEWAGARLPTEAEREKAARGTDGRKYPWGNEEPTPDLAVFRKSWGYHSTGAVGQHPNGASPYGLLDMGGNVWEWCADWYDDDYYKHSPYRDPKGPAQGVARVVRGGSWDSRPTVLSSSCRNWGYRGYRDGDFGFRCAMNSLE